MFIKHLVKGFARCVENIRDKVKDRAGFATELIPSAWIVGVGYGNAPVTPRFEKLVDVTGGPACLLRRQVFQDMFGQYCIDGAGTEVSCPCVAIAEIEVFALQGEPARLCCTVCADNYLCMCYVQFGIGLGSLYFSVKLTNCVGEALLKVRLWAFLSDAKIDEY